MSKCAAIIEIGWITKLFEANDPCGIINRVEEIQDFGCLLRMGKMEEGKRGQKELSKLESFLNKYYDGSLSMDDIRTLNVSLSIGNIICHGIAENEEQVLTLKEKISKEN